LQRTGKWVLRSELGLLIVLHVQLTLVDRSVACAAGVSGKLL
jgi:hypothetical protein